MGEGWILVVAACIALVFAIAANALASDRAPVIAIAPPALPVVNKVLFQGVDHRNQGDFGELYTNIVFAADGWVQLPSKVNGNQGIDGLFVNHDKEGAHVLIVETKTEGAALNRASGQMTKAWILSNLDQLFAITPTPRDQRNIKEIMEAVRRNSKFVQVELWTHDFVRGMTKRDVLDENARPTTMPPVHLKSASSIFMRAVFDNLRTFDKGGVYIK